MSVPGNSTDHERRIAQEASDWVVRLEDGLSPEEEARFSAWLAADPEHRVWLERRQKAWRSFDILREQSADAGAEEPRDRPEHRSRRIVRWSLPFALAAAAAAALAVATTLWWPSASERADSPLSATGPTTIALEDGSSVFLEQGAELEASMTTDSRNVFLRSGEARFDVAKDASRPFIVHAAGIDVRAVGTVFHVGLKTDAVDVLVTEGRVHVRSRLSSENEPSSEIPILVAGQRVTVPLSAHCATPQVVDMPGHTTLEFDAVTLGDAVYQLNQYNRVTLVVSDPQLRATPVVASIRSDNVEGFVHSLELTMGVRAKRDGDTIRLLPAR